MTNSKATQTQGLSILDIAPQFEDVPVSDSMLRVWGIGANDVVTMLQRFPDALLWFAGQGVNVKALALKSPDMIAAVIAAACRELGNPKAEERAATLTVEEQLDVIEATGRLTFRSGFGPFVARLAVIARAVVSENSGKAQDMNSPPPSIPLSETDTPPNTSGS